MTFVSVSNNYPLKFCILFNRLNSYAKFIQKLAKIRIYLTPYLCTERIFDSRPFMYDKIFLQKLFLKLVAHIFTLLLAPFASKLVNFCKSFFKNTLLYYRNGRLSKIRSVHRYGVR